MGNAYVTMSGTSMATPHVSGVVALIAGSAAEVTPAQIRKRLDAAVDDKGAAGREPEFGFLTPRHLDQGLRLSPA